MDSPPPERDVEPLSAVKIVHSCREKPPTAGLKEVVLRLGRGGGSCRFGDLRNGFRKSLWFAFQRQVGLRHDSDNVVLPVDDRNSPDLMFLHYLLALVDVLSVTTGDRVSCNELLDRGCLGIEAAGNH